MREQRGESAADIRSREPVLPSPARPERGVVEVRRKDEELVERPRNPRRGHHDEPIDVPPPGRDYYYRRRLTPAEILPAVGAAIGAALATFYIVRVLTQRTPLAQPRGTVSATGAGPSASPPRDRPLGVPALPAPPARSFPPTPRRPGVPRA